MTRKEIILIVGAGVLLYFATRSSNPCPCRKVDNLWQAGDNVNWGVSGYTFDECCAQWRDTMEWRRQRGQ